MPPGKMPRCVRRQQRFAREDVEASPQSSESKIRRRNSSTSSTVRYVSISDFCRWSVADIHSCSDLADIGKKSYHRRNSVLS